MVRFKELNNHIIAMKIIKKEEPPLDSVSVFKSTAKGMGRLSFHPHEAYEEELEERNNP